MLHRISTGINRPKGQHATVNKFMNYLNGSVGTVMFFNVRSALLQQMSLVNFINYADNNMFAAAKAFAESVAKGEVKVKHEDENLDSGDKTPY